MLASKRPRLVDEEEEEVKQPFQEKRSGWHLMGDSDSESIVEEEEDGDDDGDEEEEEEFPNSSIGPCEVEVDYNVTIEHEENVHLFHYQRVAAWDLPVDSSEEKFLAEMGAVETKERRDQRMRFCRPRPYEVLAGAVAEVVRYLLNITDEKYVTSEDPDSIVRTRDPRGCVCSNTVPYVFDTNYVIHNYVTTQGLAVMGPDSVRNNVTSFSFKQWAKEHNYPLSRAVMAAEAHARFQPAGEQSGPFHVDEDNPTSSIRVFANNRQTQSGAKDKYGQISSSLLMYYYMARNCGIVCFPFGSKCTNTQMVVNFGFTFNLYRLAEIYPSRAFVPQKIFNVRLRLPCRIKCSLVVWGTGKCVGVGIVEREKMEICLRFFYPYLRQCFMQRTDPNSGIELEENGALVGKVDITKRRTRDGGGAKKRKKRNIYHRKKDKGLGSKKV